jgi:hypothetical protein
MEKNTGQITTQPFSRSYHILNHIYDDVMEIGKCTLSGNHQSFLGVCGLAEEGFLFFS